MTAGGSVLAVARGGRVAGRWRLLDCCKAQRATIVDGNAILIARHEDEDELIADHLARRHCFARTPGIQRLLAAKSTPRHSQREGRIVEIGERERTAESASRSVGRLQRQAAAAEPNWRGSARSAQTS